MGRINSVVEMGRKSHADESSAYSYAFPIELPEDIPNEFREQYRKSCRIHGVPLMAFFSPGVSGSADHFVADAPSRIILLFVDAMHIITGKSESAITTLKIERSCLVAYRISEFLLDCWFTLHHSTDDFAPTMIPFPARAADFYRELARRLWTWLPHHAKQLCVQKEALALLSGRLPQKFSQFLQSHPELRLDSQSFFQGALFVSRSHRPFWPNLLLGLADDKLIALCDQYEGYPSKYGMQSTVLSLSAVENVTWVDRSILQDASIAIEVKRQGRSFPLSWPACPQLKPTAMNWIERTNSTLRFARRLDRSEPK